MARRRLTRSADRLARSCGFWPGETVAPIEQLYRLEANDGVCSGGLQPGQQADYDIVFRVPAGDRARHVDIWNSDEPGDLSGNTRIRIGR